MKQILVRAFLPGGVVTSLTPFYAAMDDVVAAWNAEREKSDKKRVRAIVTVGGVELPPLRDDKGTRVAVFAEFRAEVGIDHGAIYGSPNLEAARDELAALAAAFDAELAKRKLIGVIAGEITVGHGVWPRDAKGALGEMQTAA